MARRCCRHRQTIREVKRKIVQKQKKSRLPDDAVAALKAWWDRNSTHPFPSVSCGLLHYRELACM